MKQTILDILYATCMWLSGAVVVYHVPYLIRRGWIEGENATTRKKFVCDTCFRDTKKLKKFMDENNIQS